MMLLASLVVLVPIALAVSVVVVCRGQARYAMAAACLAVAALGFGVAVLGRIDEHPREGAASLLAALVMSAGSVAIIRKARIAAQSAGWS
jgi:hypothetical protein